MESPIKLDEDDDSVPDQEKTSEEQILTPSTKRKRSVSLIWDEIRGENPASTKHTRQRIFQALQ